MRGSKFCLSWLHWGMLSIFFSFSIAACSNGPIAKASWDAEVRRLCVMDGGLRVYETVKLPPDHFDKWGQINFYHPMRRESALGGDYIYEWDINYLKKGQPAVNGPQEVSVRRDHIKIIKKANMKLLGEVVMYHRAGGDLPGPWMPSLYRCPDASEVNEVILMGKVFIRRIEGE